MSETMLKVDGINVYYGNIHALHDISFTVNKGEIVTLIGANGAGKSTNLKTISGLLRTKTGDIVFKDKSIKTMAPHKIVGQGLAHVPEGRRIFLRMTVQENLEMGAYTQPASTIAPNLELVYEHFPRLKERSRQIAGTLSGGEQQMLAMGRAMMTGADMLLLDEPAAGLNATESREIDEVIKTVAASGVTVILVEHDMKMVMGISDRITAINYGRKLAEGTPAEVAANPEVIAAYLGTTG